MQKFLATLSPIWALRLGLGLMYLYSGFDIFRHPVDWYWAVRSTPRLIQSALVNPVGIDAFLRAQGIGEIVLAVLILSWFLPRWALRLAAALSVMEMAAILAMTGIDAITFRDIGLLGASLALLILSYRDNSFTA